MSQALKDSNAPVRHQAAWALGIISDRNAVPALVDVLKDADKGVRQQAAWALGAIGDARATQGLVVALNCGSSSIKCAVFEADVQPLPRVPSWTARVEGIGGNAEFALKSAEQREFGRGADAKLRQCRLRPRARPRIMDLDSTSP